MKRQFTVPVLTVTALICRAMCWYPVWMLVCALCNPALPHLPLITAALTGSGAVSAFLICKIRNRRGGTHLLCTVGAAILCAAAGYAVFRLTGGTVLPAVTLPITAFCTAMAASDKSADMLFSPTRFGAMMIGVVLTVGLMFTASLPVPVTETAAVCAIAAVGFLFLRNQSMLQRMVSRRSGGEGSVPQEIRRSNLRMVFILLIALTAVFFLRGQILWLLEALRDLAIAALRIGFTGLRRFFAWLGGDPPLPADPAEAIEDGAMEQPEEGRFTWLINLIIIIPTLLIAAYVWKQFVSDWLADFRDAVVSLIQRMRAKRTVHHTHGAADGAYTDTESDVKPEPRRKRRIRAWMKQFRAWQKMPDQPEKFYAGYRLLLESPAWTDTPAAADTARELCAKWRMQNADDTSLDAPTAALEQDRYALNGLPASAYAELSAALSNLSKKR